MRRLLSPLNLGFIGALALVWMLVGYEVHRAHAGAIHDATVSAMSQSQVFAEYSRSTVRRIDEYLQELRSTWAGRPEAFPDLVRHRHTAISDISFQVGVIDRDGFLAFTNLAAPKERVDLREREHFKVHAANPGADRLFISDPVKGKVSGKWSIQFTRPILRDGVFDGAVVISVGPDQFARFASSLRLSSGDVVTMVKDSGRIVARQPTLDDSNGRMLHGLPFLSPLGPQAGSYRLHAQSDGVDRIYGYHRLPEIGLTAVVGESVEQALASFREQRDAALRVGAVITLLLAALYHVLRRSITERQHAGEQRRLASLVYEATSEGMVVTTAEGRILAVNPAFSALTGYSPQEVIGKTPAVLQSGRHDRHFYAQMWAQIEACGHWQGEIWNRRKNGEIYPEWLTINTMSDADGTTVRRVALFSDITEKKRSEGLIWQQANFDTLTGLPNRRMFNDRLDMQIKRANRAGHPFALLLLDLDRFKEVNDTLGHHAGDALLKEVARRLQACVRESDTVARLGGDEFTVILDEPSEGDAVERVVQSIHTRIAEPFELQGEVVFTSASVGVTFYPRDATDPESLVKQADQAMFVAKAQGPSRCSYFTAEMQEAVQSRMRMAADLRVALAEGQFHLNYQPIVELATGRIRKVEALLRWVHPTRGPVSPATFVPVAEDIGLIGPIGDWVFSQALDDLTRWQVAVDAPVQVGINMSALQLRGADSGVANWVRLMKERGIPAAHIVVEITESSLMEERESVSMRLAELRDAGVQLSLDDFGTGYSSLAYLKRFPIDFLKIDQTFVRALGRGSSDLAMCEAIIAMAHKMNIRVVAEGVETGEQLEILRNAGCDFAQGFLFSRPVPRDELEVLLGADKVWIGDAPPATGDDRMTEDLQHRVDTPVRLARVEARRQRFAQS